MVKVCTECCPYRGGGPDWGHWCHGNCREEAMPELSLQALVKGRYRKKEHCKENELSKSKGATFRCLGYLDPSELGI